MLARLILLISIAEVTQALTIISPHRKSIEREIIPLFLKHYQEKYKEQVVVDWIDQGGAENDLRYVTTKCEKDVSLCGIDLFWGGGELTFIDLKGRGLLDTLGISDALYKEIPQFVLGMRVYDDAKTWIAAAFSAFGIFYNKDVLKLLKLPPPQNWQDLANPHYAQQISATDPRHSSTSLVMHLAVLQALGWQRGWEVLTAMAANTKRFTHSSSDPVKSVESSDTAIAGVVDFYAYGKIFQHGLEHFSYVIPSGQTVLNSDPIAILKGSKSKQVAARFIEFILTPEIQRILILKKGNPQGPKYSTLARMAVQPSAYKGINLEEPLFNPFELKEFKALDLIEEKMVTIKPVISDLIGATLVDNHKYLQDAWKEIKNRADLSDLLAKFIKPPLNEDQLEELAKKWDNGVFRNQTINAWQLWAKGSYETLARLGKKA